MTGVYVHIPFCRSRCAYCAFVSSTLSSQWHERFLAALEREVRKRCCENGEPLVSTLYVGGGTPSLLSPQRLQRLFRLLSDSFRFAPSMECTLEVNPDDVTPSFIASLRDTPVNRISMGAQSLDGGLLHFLRRRHTASQVLSAVSALQSAGYTNLSLDLIFGIPHQTLDMFRSDVSRLLSTGIPHLSAYALQIEPGTSFFSLMRRGELEEPDEELSLACYSSLISLTSEAGMEHYELSNFALPGFRSRHNSSYWTHAPYLGFGPGAHSFDGCSVRTANTDDVRLYVSRHWAGRKKEHLSSQALFNECILLSLRTKEGLSLSHVKTQFGEFMHAYLLRQAAPRISSGALIHEDDTLRLSPSALFVSNDIISDLLIVQ